MLRLATQPCSSLASYLPWSPWPFILLEQTRYRTVFRSGVALLGPGEPCLKMELSDSQENLHKKDSDFSPRWFISVESQLFVLSVNVVRAGGV